MSLINILIADDHELVRDGVKSRLESNPKWKVCAEAADGRQAVELAQKHTPAIAILDIGLPELNGIEVTARIRRLSPETEILIFTLQDSDDLIRRALQAGAHGFVLKSDAGRVLEQAVTALVQHRPYFTGKVANLLLDGFLAPKDSSSPSADRLTPREKEVLQLLAEAKTSKEIVQLLGVSFNTVEAHRANIMRKLNLHSVAELVRYSIRNNIIDA